ncbi:TIGR02530 family flagellar biosynthesis protein [Oscillospiraceae bacterium LTW-04]|nr:TIGR02530 family flagellar biosynthesis protein [Oscillospiraceae bacterium MB24-C1]
MDNLYLGRLSLPITTGAAQPYRPETASSSSATLPQSDSPSFQSLLQQQLQQNAGVEFSKHAVSRVAQRNIELTDNSLERLNQGVKIAQEKGLDSALILIDKTAFIVSAQNNKVITTVGESDLTGNVFTNIDGTVII